ncbi:thiol:disulfide interchange protein DsbA/DsbL [Marinicella rhabdoformis]|uniref:thiol:disulfide interchange protein DsbA/DsbL n=1 Tax=Marinicella rhabdoformis TaxID=2580566 RepID=UPI0012AEBDA9|nr:thiol:disulfide interchange protein DsbA/DsbL [Marinicella rhabdoformis]
MKKLTLFLALFLVISCSNADQQEAEAKVEAIKTEATKAVETAKSEVKEAAEEAVTEQVAKATNTVAKKVMPAEVNYQAGIHYTVLNPAWDTETEDEVVVYEFFGYLCPHCYSFQPYMKAFEQRKKDNVKLVRVPVVFQPIWKIYAQAYYTAESMDLLEKSHNAFFEAIHQHKKQFRTIEQIADWYASSFGVDKDKFLSTANSFMIDGMIRKGDQMMRQMQVQSTPTVVVNGKFKPNAKQLKTREGMMDLVDYLIDAESK